MRINTHTTANHTTLTIETAEWYQSYPLEPGQTVTQCLIAHQNDIDQKIRRLQVQRARVNQALTHLTETQA
jgi:hypothetical protein